MGVFLLGLPSTGPIRPLSVWNSGSGSCHTLCSCWVTLGILISQHVADCSNHRSHCSILKLISASINLTNAYLSIYPSPCWLCYDDIIHMLLTRQSVHVDSLGRQADAHVPAQNKRRKTCKTCKHICNHPRVSTFRCFLRSFFEKYSDHTLMRVRQRTYYLWSPYISQMCELVMAEWAASKGVS